MWQVYTERARRCIFHAQEDAADLKQRIVEPHHLYLGLLQEESSNSTDLLLERGIDRLQLRALLLEQSPVGEWDLKTGEMELSEASKAVLDLAYAAAKECARHTEQPLHIGTEHLLVALIEHTGIGATPAEAAAAPAR
jgi:ATP-dependent Clp protease ATP-binding subunit ClpC